MGQRAEGQGKTRPRRLGKQSNSLLKQITAPRGVGGNLLTRLQVGCFIGPLGPSSSLIDLLFVPRAFVLSPLMTSSGNKELLSWKPALTFPLYLPYLSQIAS